MPQLTSQEKGLFGEAVTKDYYQRRGFRVVALREFNRTGRRVGEIDCIAVRDHHIHFIEVKTRVGRHALVSALDSVDRAKQRKFVRAVYAYLQTHREYGKFQLHIDMCIVELHLDNQVKCVTILSDAMQGYG